MLVEKLEKEARELRTIIRKVENRKTDGPQRSLRISQKKTGIEFYIKTYSASANTNDVECIEEIEHSQENCIKEKEIKYISEEYEKKRDKKISNGHYLKKKDIKMAKDIAQRDYDVKLLKQAKARLHAIEIF